MKLFFKTIAAILILLTTVTTSVNAQQLAMGKWNTHIAYNSVEQIAQSANKIYAVSEGSLYSVDKEDGGIEFYSKLTGLNDAGISRIEYDTVNDQLLIVYTNGNIDVMNSGGVINLPDLFNKQISSGKSVNHIFFYDNKAYLSCSFGVLVINMQKKEIADTYFIGPNASEVKVLNVNILNGKIYATTINAIYTADVTNPNLVNYEFWTTIASLPGSGDIKKLITFNNQLILHRGTALYRQNSDNTWEQIASDLSVNYCNVSGNKLFALSSDSKLYLINTDYSKSLIEGIGVVSDTEYDYENATAWFAASTFGVISYTKTESSAPEIKTYKPVGPSVNSPWSMVFAGQKLFVVPGGRWAGEYNLPAYVMMYEKGQWNNIDGLTIKAITNGPVRDFINIAVDPVDNTHFFVTSYGTGLYEFKNNEFFKWHNYLNSTIETIIPDNPFNYMRVDGAVIDKSGNLFLANMGKNIKVLLNDGVTWTELSYPEAAKPNLGQILISNQNQNQKWIPAYRYTPGIFIFDDGGSITDQSDDKSIFLSSFADTDNDGGVITPTSVYCLTQDKNGVIWAGTEQGPLLFYNTANAFKTGYTCSRVKIPRNDDTNLADYLLIGERIKCIAIDGANRKWLGTEGSGVYLMSENGQVTVEHFTTANSPLLSNNIMSIAINPVTGEVFFGTSQGIVSYQSDASEAESTFKDVHAYPNPVRENYNGVITITGLVEDTQLKITDITGNLVCQTVSNGSIATWDGKDIRGNKVSTGIYLVIGVNADGTQSTITKIMVIN